MDNNDGEHHRYIDTFPHMRKIDLEYDDEAEIASHQAIQAILVELKTIKSDIATLKSDLSEMLDYWNSAKGFIKIIRIFGELAKWAVGVGAAFGAVWWWIRK